MGAAWVRGCWWVIEVREIGSAAGRPVRISGSCFQYRQDNISCRLIFPTSQHTTKCFFVYTSAIVTSKMSRQKARMQHFVAAIASAAASQLQQGGEKALQCCPVLQAEALRREEFIQVPMQGSRLEISARTGKILSAADRPCGLQMVRPEGVHPKPMGKTGMEILSSAKAYQSLGCKPELKIKCSVLGRALQQNENEMFERCGVPVSLVRAVIPCVASLMKKMTVQVTNQTIFIFISFLIFFR